ncbi:MAG: glycosyltransferase family 4 protein [Candidatus Woesearchaeota archaeon]
MHIAYLTPTFSSYSGIDHVVRNQAKAALAEGHEVTILCFEADMKVEGARIIELGLPRSLFLARIYRLFAFLDRRMIKRAARLIKNADKAIAHFYPMTFVAGSAKKRYGTNYTYWNHGFPHPSAFSSRIEGFYVFLMRSFLPYSLKNVDEAVSISDFMRRELSKDTRVESRVEYNEIDPEVFHERVSPGSVRDDHGIGEDPLFLYVGRITTHKGIHLLLESFRIVKRSLPDAHLLVVGMPRSDQYFDELKQRAVEGVEFVDRIVEIPSYYAAADVCVTASLWEGYNLTIAEANACGTPVVAYDIGPHKEVIKRGVLVEPKDVEGFAEAMITQYTSR